MIKINKNRFPAHDELGVCVSCLLVAVIAVLHPTGEFGVRRMVMAVGCRIRRKFSLFFLAGSENSDCAVGKGVQAMHEHD